MRKRIQIMIGAIALMIPGLGMVCFFKSTQTTAFEGNFELHNGQEVRILKSFNDSGLSELQGIESWFGSDKRAMVIKKCELEKLELAIQESVLNSTPILVAREDQISCYWDESSKFPDLALIRDIENQIYKIDINYDMRTTIAETITTDIGRDVLAYLLSFVSGTPKLLEELLYMDCFINDETLITDTEWYTVEDCDVQWNADNGYGITFVIKHHH